MRFSPPCLVVLAVLALGVLPGCGYIHFGRYEPAVRGSPELAAQNADLRLENKILRQEIALAHQERATLREALENRVSTESDASELVAQLDATTRELGALRANYTRLQSELGRLRSAPAGSTGNIASLAEISALQAKLGLTEEKLSATETDLQQLQQDNIQLRREADRLARENAGLAQQVETLVQQNEQVSGTFAQLNTELLAQKEARQQAEAATRAARDQLQLVLTRRAESESTALSDARQGTAAGARDLQASLTLNTAATEPPPTAELRTSPERLRAAAAAAAAEEAALQAGAVRYHLVAEGDTLENLARHYYGRPERWRVIYAANNDLLRGGRPLKPGMRLVIPE
jgi:chromosome segregation ATPase/phage tail protein X